MESLSIWSLAGVVLNPAVIMAVRLNTQRVWHTFNYDVTVSNGVNRGVRHGAPRRTRFRNPLDFTWISDFRMDFWISKWISGFQVDFWISKWISGFQSGFLDFKVDFWISKWISGFQSGFLDFKVDFWISSGFLDFI